MQQDTRFIVKEEEGNGLTRAFRQVIVDKETGVNYLFVRDGYAGGLTVLLDAEGKPILSR